MESDEEIFHRAFAHVGGSSRLRENSPWKSTFSTVEQFYDIIKKLYVNRPNTPMPYISIVDSPQFNAQVIKFENRYFIGIFEGAYRFLFDLFGMMLCSPKILIDIGDISKEQELPSIYNAQFTNYFHYLSSNEYHYYEPICNIRKEARKNLTATALLTILFHEYAHIVFGHLDFIISLKKNINSFIEHTELSILSNKLESLLSQTLEFDADNYSYSMIYRLTESYFVEHEKQPLLVPFLQNTDEALRLYTFAIYSWHRLFGMYNENKIDLLSISHPPSGIRQDDLISVVHTITKYEKDNNEADRVANIMLKSAQEVEIAFTVISEQSYNNKAFSISFSTEYESHHELIRSNWKNVRPLLEPFSYFNLTLINKKYL